MREREIKLFNSITNVYNEYIEEAQAEIRKKKPAWIKWFCAAAFLCLILAGAINTLMRFDYFSYGCGACPGTTVNGVYYFEQPHDGVYAYTPGESAERLLSAYWEDGWQVNGYGLYYVRGRSLYVRPHETGKSRRLFTAKGSTHIALLLQPDENVIVTAYYKRSERISEILVDGKTGEVIENVMSPTPYEEYYKSGKYSGLNYTVGKRRIELVRTGKDETVCTLRENGKSIFKDDISVYDGSGIYFGNVLVLSGYREDLVNSDYDLLVILRPDGNDNIFTVPAGYYHAGTQEYLFYTRRCYNSSPAPIPNEVWCLSLADGETWKLETSGETAVEFYDISASDEYLYACAPWDETQECWRIERDSKGKPVKITLMDGNITD